MQQTSTHFGAASVQDRITLQIPKSMHVIGFEQVDVQVYLAPFVTNKQSIILTKPCLPLNLTQVALFSVFKQSGLSGMDNLLSLESCPVQNALSCDFYGKL